MEKLNFMNGPLSGKLKHTSLGNNHELLDYILVKSKKIKFQSIERRILNMSVDLNIDSIQLSDPQTGALGEDSYVMNARDLNALSLIPKLCEHGISDRKSMTNILI